MPLSCIIIIIIILISEYWELLESFDYSSLFKPITRVSATNVTSELK